MNFKNSDWRLIVKDGGHSVWEHLPTGDYSIRDTSGSYPHLTDDGVLWIKGVKDIEGKTVQLTVIAERDGKEYSVFIDADFAKRLTPHISLKWDPKILVKIMKNAQKELVFASELLSLSTELLETGT